MTDEAEINYRIGHGTWLKDYEIRGPKALLIDELLEPLQSFFRCFETDCSAGCCGIDAFSFPPKLIREAALTDPIGPDRLLARLNDVMTAVKSSDADSICPDPFNNHLSRKTFEQLIEHFITHVKTVAPNT